MDTLRGNTLFIEWLKKEIRAKNTLAFGIDSLMESIPQKLHKLSDIQSEDILKSGIGDAFELILINNLEVQGNIKSEHIINLTNILKYDGKLLVVDLIGNEEQSLSYFINLQNEYIILSGIKVFNNHLLYLYEKLKQPLHNYEQYINTFNDLNEYYNSVIENLKEDLTERKQYKDLYLEEKAEKINYLKDLFDQYTNREKDLEAYKNLLVRYEDLLKKYKNLRKSKLGKLTSKYWELRRKISKK